MQVENLIVTYLGKRNTFKEPEVSPPCSKEPVIGPYPKPVGIEVFTAASTKMAVFCVVAP
jgi:hypothetical protein